MNTRLPVLVVGGGLAGLATAALLRAKDIPVKVFETTDRVGGRYGIAPAWFPMRKDSAPAAFAAESKLALGTPARLALRIFTDRAGALHTGTFAFVMKTDAGSLSSRAQMRTVLSKTAVSVGRFNEFEEKEGLGGDLESFSRALTGPAAAEMRTTPHAAFALAREVILDKNEMYAYPGGVERAITELSKNAGEICLNTKVEGLRIENGVANGVFVVNNLNNNNPLNNNSETSLVEGSAVVLALPVPAARALFDESAWAAVSAEERQLYDACHSRPGMYVQYSLAEKLKENIFTFVHQPPSFMVGVGSQLFVHTAFAVEQDVTKEDIDLRLEAVRATASKLVPAIVNSTTNVKHQFEPFDDCYTAMAGGRERPHHSVPGIDDLYLAGNGANAPGIGFERVLASARIVARQIARSVV